MQWAKIHLVFSISKIPKKSSLVNYEDEWEFAFTECVHCYYVLISKKLKMFQSWLKIRMGQSVKLYIFHFLDVEGLVEHLSEIIGEDHLRNCWSSNYMPHHLPPNEASSNTPYPPPSDPRWRSDFQFPPPPLDVPMISMPFFIRSAPIRLSLLKRFALNW